MLNIHRNSRRISLGVFIRTRLRALMVMCLIADTFVTRSSRVMLDIEPTLLPTFRRLYVFYR